MTTHLSDLRPDTDDVIDDRCPAYIYALLDPESGVTRYVGKTDRLADRLTHHLSHCESGATHCQRWIRGLRRRGLMPTMVALEVCQPDEWPDRERRWIEHFRMHGAPLTNTADGGRGAPGARHSAEARARMSERAKADGRRPTMAPNHGELMRAKFLGRKHTAEASAKIGDRFRGQPLSQEHRAKLSKRKREMYASGNDQRDALSRRYAVISDEQVIEVWRLAMAGAITQAEIGRRYGVQPSTVSEIKTGKRYKHVTRPQWPEGDGA